MVCFGVLFHDCSRVVHITAFEPNQSMSHLLPQSGEVCRGGQLAPGTFDDWQPISAFTQQLDGPAHGGFSSGANGHERQRLHRGFCAASHQAPFRHQCRALQEAGVPHELQAARTPTNEPMTLGSPTNAGPLWVSLPFPFVLSKRLVGFLFLLWLTLSTPITSSSSSAFPSLTAWNLLT